MPGGQLANDTVAALTAALAADGAVTATVSAAAPGAALASTPPVVSSLVPNLPPPQPPPPPFPPSPVLRSPPPPPPPYPPFPPPLPLCPLSVSVTPSFPGGSLPRASAAYLFGSAQPNPKALGLSGDPGLYSGQCSLLGGLAYSWQGAASRSGALSLGAQNWAQYSTLYLPALTLPAGEGVNITLTVCYASAPARADLCGRATVTFLVQRSPLVPVISGGGAVVGDRSTVFLDASRSYDPDDPAAKLSFYWQCAPVASPGAPCLAPSGAAAQLGTGAVQAVQLKGSEGEGTPYNLTLTVTGGVGKAVQSASTVLTFLTGSGPVVKLQGLPMAKVNPNNKLTLFASLSTLSADNVSSVWSVASVSGGPPLNLSDPSVALTPTGSSGALYPSLVLAPGALEPGATYVFRLSALDSYGPGRATITVPVSRAPRGADGSPLGQASVSPAQGFGLQTPFSLSATGWLDEDGPLSFQWSYLLPGSQRAVPLTGFRADYRAASFQLPAADLLAPAAVTVQLLVQNAYGVATAVPANATAMVSWAPGSYTYAAVSAKVSDARQLARDGRPEDSLSIVGALSSLLNFGASVSSGGGSGAPQQQAAPPPPPVPALPGRTQDQSVRAFFRQDLMSVVALARSSRRSPPTIPSSPRRTRQEELNPNCPILRNRPSSCRPPLRFLRRPARCTPSRASRIPQLPSPSRSLRPPR